MKIWVSVGQNLSGRRGPESQLSFRMPWFSQSIRVGIDQRCGWIMNVSVMIIVHIKRGTRKLMKGMNRSSQLIPNRWKHNDKFGMIPYIAQAMESTSRRRNRDLQVRARASPSTPCQRRIRTHIDIHRIRRTAPTALVGRHVGLAIIVRRFSGAANNHQQLLHRH